MGRGTGSKGRARLLGDTRVPCEHFFSKMQVSHARTHTSKPTPTPTRCSGRRLARAYSRVQLGQKQPQRALVHRSFAQQALVGRVGRIFCAENSNQRTELHILELDPHSAVLLVLPKKPMQATPPRLSNFKCGCLQVARRMPPWLAWVELAHSVCKAASCCSIKKTS